MYVDSYFPCILVTTRTPAVNVGATPGVAAGVFGTPAYGSNYMQVRSKLDNIDVGRHRSIISESLSSKWNE